MLNYKPIQIFFASIIFTLLPFSTAFAETLTKFDIIDDEVSEPLSGIAGDPEKGRQIAINRDKGNCLSCHSLPISEEIFHGTIGPTLSEVGSRLTKAQIRLRLIDMKRINPISIMPGFYKPSEQLTRIAPQYEGTTLLSAQEIEHIIAYLSTLTSQTSKFEQ